MPKSVKSFYKVYSTALSDKLFFAEGNVFELNEDEFDGAVVFIEPGFTNTNGDFIRKKDKLATSSIKYAVFGGDSIMDYPFFRRDFPKNLEVEFCIQQMAYDALDAVWKEGCRRIAFHGIRNVDVDDRITERMAIKGVHAWVRSHYDDIDYVMMVDMYNCYCKHQFAEAVEIRCD